jgi:hypothetical protein
MSEQEIEQMREEIKYTPHKGVDMEMVPDFVLRMWKRYNDGVVTRSHRNYIQYTLRRWGFLPPARTKVEWYEINREKEDKIIRAYLKE